MDHVFYNGALAGIVADVVTHPVSTAKARLYTQSYAGGKAELRGTWHAMTSIVRNEGILRLYTGFSVCMLSAPARAMYFTGYEGAKRHCAAACGPDHPAVAVCAGAAAQFSGSLLWVPMDVTKERMQIQTEASGALRRYQNPFQAGLLMAREEGFRSLYRGFLLHQMLWLPFNAIFWPLYEGSKKFLGDYKGIKAEGEEASLPLWGYPVCSLASATLAGAATNPIDFIKVRLQTGTQSQYSGAMDCLSKTLRAEGAASLFRGTSARVLWIAPNMMLTLSIFDILMKHPIF